MQELIDELKKLQETQDPYTLQDAIEFAESMLEEEKEVIEEFATDYERECRINLERSIEKCWHETFNTKER